MESRFEIYPDHQLIVYTVIGKPTYAEMSDLYASIAADPSFDVSYNGVGDLRAVETNMSRADTVELATEVVKKHLTSGQWVTLVDSSMTTALALIYEGIVTDQHPFTVCSTVGKASAVLGVDLTNKVRKDYI